MLPMVGCHWNQRGKKHPGIKKKIIQKEPKMELE
jgi:hypothetical protein